MILILFSTGNTFCNIPYICISLPHNYIPLLVHTESYKIGDLYPLCWFCKKIKPPIWNICSVSTLHVQVCEFSSRFILVIFIIAKKKMQFSLYMRHSIFPHFHKYFYFLQLWNFQLCNTIYTLSGVKRK